MEKSYLLKSNKRKSAATSEVNIVDYTINLMKKWHPNAEIEFISYQGHNNPVEYKCLKCGAIDSRSKGKNFWRSKYACLKCQDGIIKEEPESKKIIIQAFQEKPIMKLLEFHGHQPCKVQCLRCGNVLSRYASNIIKNPYFCSYCDIPKPHQAMPQEQAQQWLNEITKNEDFEILEFQNTTLPALVRHKICGFIFKRRIYNFNISRGCPKCDRKRSLLEKQTEQYLLENKFNYSIQKRFPDCNNGRSSFDFCLYSRDHDIILIEVQGQQHYQEVDIFEKDLATIQRRDKIKEEYCQANNIPLIKIPYWDINKLSQYLPVDKFNDYRNLEEKVE